jgi:hypothetical protein
MATDLRFRPAEEERGDKTPSLEDFGLASYAGRGARTRVRQDRHAYILANQRTAAVSVSLHLSSDTLSAANQPQGKRVSGLSAWYSLAPPPPPQL